MLSNMENILSELEGMFDSYFNRHTISRGVWTNVVNTAIRNVNDFQNLVSLFKYASNDLESKEEMFSVEDVIKTVTENLTILSLNNESQFELQFEQGVPD